MHFYKNCITTIPTNFYFSENKTKFIFFFLQTNLLLLCITDQSITKIINIIWSKQAGFVFFGGKSWKKNQQQLCNMKTERKLGQQWQDFLPFFVCLKEIFSMLQAQALFHEMDLPPAPNKNPTGNKDANRTWVTLGMGMEMNRRQENETEMDTSKTRFISIGNNPWQYNCPQVSVIKLYGGDGFLLAVI